MNTDINPTMTLRNAHGAFTVDVDRLNIAMIRYSTLSDDSLRDYAARMNGHDSGEAYRSDSRLECLVMLVEGGNY